MKSESSPDRHSASVVSRLVRWLLVPDPAKRYSFPGLVAYHWTGGDPKACSVGNISSSGLYVLTDEHWLPGSVVPMTLQTNLAHKQSGEDWIAVLTRVVRSGPDGFGLAFVYSGPASTLGDFPPERVANDKNVKRFLRLLLDAL